MGPSGTESGTERSKAKERERRERVAHETGWRASARRGGLVARSFVRPVRPVVLWRQPRHRCRALPLQLSLRVPRARPDTEKNHPREGRGRACSGSSFPGARRDPSSSARIQRGRRSSSSSRGKSATRKGVSELTSSRLKRSSPPLPFRRSFPVSLSPALSVNVPTRSTMTR